jgi:uncharacterized membrane protein YbhN (UPF0104 family)/tRNA A-37 threonylcarbamoyl transferase component Bud32
VTVEEREAGTGILTAVAPRRWAPAVFGVVPKGASRRRPSDIVRLVASLLVIVITAFGADNVVALEHRVFDLLTDLPDWVTDGAVICYRIGAVGTVVVLALAFLFTRRFRLLALVGVAGVLGWLAAFGMDAWIDAEAPRQAAGIVVSGRTPDYPVVVLAIATTVLLVAAPYLLRPARRTIVALLTFGAFGALVGVLGLPEDVVASVALGWGVAAAFHLVVGTPAATPSLAQVDKALVELGVSVTNVRLAEHQVWGETRFDANGLDGSDVAIDVIGRDATDARLFAKVWRFIWYKDSGANLSITRTQQLEHRAYLLLLAARAGVPVNDVVIAGMGGPDATALLVMRRPDGVPLTDVPVERITDAVLDDAWRNRQRLHDQRLAHGELRAGNVLLRDDGSTALVDFASASSGAPAERSRLDAVELLVTTAALVGSQRALAAAERALGVRGLADVLPMVQPTALSAGARHEVEHPKPLLAELREAGEALTGEELAPPTELRRVSPTDILLAAGTILGVYLLIGQLAGIDWSTTFDDAEWGWVFLAFCLSLLPPFTGAIALMGSVAVTLPYKAVVGEQYANNFTGLVGGTVATTALVIRFFQKQGQKIAVAASSGVLNSLAGMIVQIILVAIGLVFTSSEFTPSDGGGRSIAGLVIVVIVVGGIALAISLVVPRLRRRLRGMIAPQLQAARENLRGILTTPRKAAMLFGGNVATQVLFAIVLSCSVHAYGESVSLLQLIVINSLASVLGGMAPVPGGLGVVEAGLIGGLTAAGVPQTEAVAATFTHRLFTAYLSPIWGWFALQWMRRNDYV